MEVGYHLRDCSSSTLTSKSMVHPSILQGPVPSGMNAPAAQNVFDFGVNLRRFVFKFIDTTDDDRDLLICAIQNHTYALVRSQLESLPHHSSDRHSRHIRSKLLPIKVELASIKSARLGIISCGGGLSSCMRHFPRSVGETWLVLVCLLYLCPYSFQWHRKRLFDGTIGYFSQQEHECVYREEGVGLPEIFLYRLVSCKAVRRFGQLQTKVGKHLFSNFESSAAEAHFCDASDVLRDIFHFGLLSAPDGDSSQLPHGLRVKSSSLRNQKECQGLKCEEVWSLQKACIDQSLLGQSSVQLDQFTDRLTHNSLGFGMIALSLESAKKMRREGLFDVARVTSLIDKLTNTGFGHFQGVRGSWTGFERHCVADFRHVEHGLWPSQRTFRLAQARQLWPRVMVLFGSVEGCLSAAGAEAAADGCDASASGVSVSDKDITNGSTITKT
ncbi:hypothetical protein KCU61_g534, partial [Aureobasidium melanogenum]